MRIRPFMLAVLAVLCLHGSALHSEKKPPVLLVYGFAHAGPDASHSWMGRVLAESVAADLGNRADFTVVSHPDRKKALDELARKQTGLFADNLPDGASEKKEERPAEPEALALGRMLGADYILTGSYSVYGGRVRIISRLVRASDGQIWKAAKVEGVVNHLFALADRIVPELLVSEHSSFPDKLVLMAPGPDAFSGWQGAETSESAFANQQNGSIKIGGPAAPGKPGKPSEIAPDAGSLAPEQVPAGPEIPDVVALNPEGVAPGKAAQGSGNIQAYDWYARGLAVMYSDPTTALYYFENALEIEPEFADACLNAAFVAGNELDRSGLALRFLERARPLVEKETRQEATYFRIKGLSLAVDNRHAEALAALQTSKQILKRLGQEVSADFAFTLNNIANVYYRMKRYGSAIPYIHQAIALLEKLGLQGTYKYSIFINNRGALHNARREFELARQDLEESRRILIRLNLEESSFGALVNANLGDIYYEQGNFIRANIHQEKAKSIKVALGLR